MDFLAADLSEDQIYKLMTGLIVPRPIAWVTTHGSEGTVNLAPFSAFTFLSTIPPIIGISITRRSSGLKDTLRNVQRNGEFVVNIADESLVEAVHGSSAEYPPDISEPELLGLDCAASHVVAVPRIAAAPAAMECRLERIIEFGEKGAELVVGRIVHFYVRDDLVVDGKIATDTLRPLARIAGPRYAPIGPVVEMTPLHEGSRRYAATHDEPQAHRQASQTP
ncbi:flavin reductase family protein [Chelativorans sp. Marseille-P2723]|uniref:flavin reductase family protein n=1 Tax=Chelativorans sp. Marseille-P2723 TaxID=2709133 RepID=UPI00157100E0|nr:flavin reductase family protein [Chelativorans sp. Marseille-P2723]